MKPDEVAWTFVLFSVLYLAATGVEYDLDPLGEGTLNFTQIADKLGLKYEVHEVSTHDGYLLTLFHLPGDSARPVFLLSGNFGSADDYIVRENTSLVAVLQGAGLDVWAGNWRGCKYGRRHRTLDPDRDRQFWDYSIHEYAKYDAAAQIDYILNKTGAKRVACIGYSMGTTTFYLLGAMRPEYNDKVAVVISLAPIGYVHHSVIFQLLLPMWPFANALMEWMDVNEIAGSKNILTTFMRYVCRSKEIGYEMCINRWFFPWFGYDADNLEPQFSPVVFGHFPSPISSKSLRHMVQIMINHRIAQYDYGPEENFRRYGSVIAPDYELGRNNMSVVLISGKNDPIATLADADMLKAQLPNVVDHLLLEPKEFNHIDFVYGKKTHKVLYKTHILDYLNKYLPKS